jgi:zinc transporter 7
MGIAIHNMSAAEGRAEPSLDLAAALRRDANGLLGTTVQYGELVREFIALGSLLTETISI